MNIVNILEKCFVGMNKEKETRKFDKEYDR